VPFATSLIAAFVRGSVVGAGVGASVSAGQYVVGDESVVGARGLAADVADVLLSEGLGSGALVWSSACGGGCWVIGAGLVLAAARDGAEADARAHCAAIHSSSSGRL
jgi:hypothetical protein